MRFTQTFRRWHHAYLEAGLTPQQTRFWGLFCGAVLVSCTLFYLHDQTAFDWPDPRTRVLARKAVGYFCLMLPALVLRRLHPYALLFGVNFLLDLRDRGRE
jgi:hypothetical protein